MTWKPKIERLRPYVIAECKDIPPDLVLAIIQHESGGIAGRKSAANTRAGTLYDIDGNPHVIKNALGLMQTIPATINSYNRGKEETAQFATIEDLTGTDERAIRLQIRIGCRYLAIVNRLLNNNYPDTCTSLSLSDADDNQTSLVLTGYAVGAGNTLKKMAAAQKQNYTPTFANLKRLFPTWGGKANHPLKYVARVMSNYRANRGKSFTGQRPGDIVARIKNSVEENKGGAIALAVCLTAAGWAVQRYFSRREES